MKLLLNKTIIETVSKEFFFKDISCTGHIREKALLLVALLTRRHLRSRNRCYFLNCSAKRWLKPLLGHHYYNRILDYLEEKGFLGVNAHYWRGNYPKSYRIMAPYLTDFVEMEFDYVPPKAVRFDPKQCPFLDRVSFGTAGKTSYEKKLRRLKNPWRIACYTHNFEAIIKKDWWCTIGRRSKRLFSNVTSLPKDHRPVPPAGDSSRPAQCSGAHSELGMPAVL